MKHVLAATFVLLLAGCATLSEPNLSNALVVGTVEQWGVGYPSNNGARLNGTHRTGIVLTFKNSETGVKYNITSSNGTFRSTTIPEGEYRLVNLHFEIKDSAGSNSAGISFSSKPFTVKSNQVLNLGHVVLKMDFATGLAWGQQTFFDKVREPYLPIKTAWNDLEWVNIPL